MPNAKAALKNRHTGLGPNADLIGQPGSRNLLSTPCLVLDRPALEGNVASAAAYAASRRMALRPHAKSHKCSRIAALQIEAGAVGICAATVGEAEALCGAGIGNILVTSTLSQPAKMERLVRLAKSGCAVMAVADDPGLVDLLGAVAQAHGMVIDVLVDVDLGRHRNGVTSVEQALAVAARIASNLALRFKGLQAYASHISHVEGFAERTAAAQKSVAEILKIRAALAAAGHVVLCISGGSTGTLHIDAGMDCYTELQCGSYVFNDVEYRSIDLDGRNGDLFAPALFVRVSVIGRNVAGRVTCDGGNKHFSAKGTLPAFLAPPVPGAVYRPDSDEHGIIELPAQAAQPALGTGFELIVPHCDPTLNLYDHLHVVEDDTLADIWLIEGRGAF